MKKYSIVIPAYNEECGIGKVLEELLHTLPKESFEIVVVDDCSADKTALEIRKYPVRAYSNIQNSGYGYSLKRGISEAKNEHIIILDADGSYPVVAIPQMVAEYERGFDMVVGVRQGKFYRGSTVKRVARFFFRVLSEFSTGRRIPDINSGLRIFRKDLATRFFSSLSSGFSFTTTITLIFMLNSYTVQYMPIEYHKRKGSSKVRYFRDTLRSAQIIVESIVFYNPIKIFFLFASIVFIAGCISIALAFFSLPAALSLFLTVFGTVVTFGIGCIPVFLKHMYNGLHATVRKDRS